MVLLCFWYVFGMFLLALNISKEIRVFRWVSQLRPRSGAMFEIRKVRTAVIPPLQGPRKSLTSIHLKGTN